MLKIGPPLLLLSHSVSCPFCRKRRWPEKRALALDIHSKARKDSMKTFSSCPFFSISAGTDVKGAGVGESKVFSY